MNFLLFLLPACMNCKHYKSYLPGRKYDDLAKCTKFNMTMYAEVVRLDHKHCGITGKWFEPKL
jgi:hypothetical protein